MSETSITRKTLEEAKKEQDLTDWDKVRSMSEEEIESNALSDLDNQILSPENSKHVRRVNRKRYHQSCKEDGADIRQLNFDTLDKGLRDFVKDNYIDKMTNNSEKFLLLEIVNKYNFHFEIAANMKGKYETINWLFSICIPIYSAILTFILAGTFESIRVYLPFLGLGLTIFTILSSVIKPYERSKSASNLLITLNDWKVAFIVGLNEYIEPAKIEQSETLIDFLVNKNNELSGIGESMLERFIPSTYDFK